MEDNTILTEEVVLKLLKDLDQHHVIERYNTASDSEKKELIEQINHLEKAYPGGLSVYVARATKLLLDSKNNINPYADFKPSVPSGEILEVGNQFYFEMEALGMELMKDTAFVLVAGGLGERLGYNDIKIGIPSELVTRRTFFEIYIDYIKAYETRIRASRLVEDSWCIPLVIMTSDDTEKKTIKMLEENNYFLMEGQISIVKQDKVPALLDDACHFALESNKCLIDTKPHGHGDVHHLLFSNGIIKNWISQGKKYLVFFQDTNALVFNCIPSAIGVSHHKNFVMNTIAIPRVPKEAVGGLCKLTSESTGQSLTLNVEYNQLDPLLRDKYNPNGDVANEKGFSDFPGNTNVLIFEMKTYYETLESNKGDYPEFVNPKYADESKTKFKSATRVECMMQDFPKLFKNNEAVGFTMYERWFCFSTCKNNLNDGCDKLKKGGVPETAFSVEQDIFSSNLNLLKILNKVKVNNGNKTCSVDVQGVQIKFGPKVIILPSFASTLEELNRKIQKEIEIESMSSLILAGENNRIDSLYLEGSLDLRSDEIRGESVKNSKYHIYLALTEGQGLNYEQIRGYTVVVEEK
jgi:UDP-sugar pyrophosphorylase